MDISSTIRVVASLVVVFFLLLIFLYYLRKFRINDFSQNNGEINILEKKYLGSNKHLILIQVKQRESLIAIAGDNIEHLWTDHINESSRTDGRLS